MISPDVVITPVLTPASDSHDDQAFIVDDKSAYCVPFILRQLHANQAINPQEPFFIGLNGVQGAGKTTLVKALAQTLREKEGLETLVLSIDDLYLTHEDQVALANKHRDNPLVQHRGEPGEFVFLCIPRTVLLVRG